MGSKKVVYLHTDTGSGFSQIHHENRRERVDSYISAALPKNVWIFDAFQANMNPQPLT